MHIRFLIALFSFLFFQSTPPAGDPPKGDPPADPPKPDEVMFDAKQQEKLNALLAAERKRTEEATAARLKQELADAKAAEDAEAERKRQEAAGEFDKVKNSLTSERDAAVTERDGLKERLDAALKVITDTVAASWKDVPEEVRDLYDGPDDDPLAKQTFLAKPATQKLIERLADKPSTRGNGPNPDPSDGTRDINKAIETAKANPKYSF